MPPRSDSRPHGSPAKLVAEGAHCIAARGVKRREPSDDSDSEGSQGVSSAPPAKKTGDIRRQEKRSAVPSKPDSARGADHEGEPDIDAFTVDGGVPYLRFEPAVTPELEPDDEAESPPNTPTPIRELILNHPAPEEDILVNELTTATATAGGGTPSPPPLFQFGLSREAIMERNVFVLHVYGQLKKLRRKQRKNRNMAAALRERVSSLETRVEDLEKLT